MLNKPLPGASLNPGPLTRGLQSCFLFNEGSGLRVNDYAAAPRSGSLNGAIWNGRALTVAGPNQIVELRSSNDMFGVNVSDLVTNLTIFLKVNPLSTAGGKTFGPKIYSYNSSYYLNASIPADDGKVKFNVGAYNSIEVTPDSLGYDTWAFVVSDSRGMEIWQNGEMIASDPAQFAYWSAVAGLFCLGDCSIDGDAAFKGIPSNFDFFYTYNRALSASEIKGLTVDPFTMFSNSVSKLAYLLPDAGTSSGGGAEVGGSAIILTGGTSGGAVLGRRTTNFATRLPTALYRLNFTLDPRSGAFVGGSALAGFEYPDIGSGGSLGGGAAVVAIQVAIYGGGVVGGTAPISLEITKTVTGGAVAGSSAPINTELQIIGTGGTVCGGSAISEVIINGKGGAVGGGVELDQMIFAPVIVGNCQAGGTALIQVDYQNVKLSTFGCIVGGKAVVTRKGVSHNIRSGIARCLEGENIVKTADEARLAKEKIRTRRPTPSIVVPTLPPGYRYERLPTWCDIKEPCKKGAVLPKITQVNQGGSLPAKNRNAT